MEYRELGRTGLKVSSCCLGTMTFGEQNSEAEGHAQLDYAFERGVTFLDTAELYAIPPRPETQGSTERIIGSWLQARQNRDQVVIATKIVGRSDMAWHREGKAELLDGGLTRHTQKQIDYAVEQSLRRLNTDYIDLYQLHWPDRAYQAFGYQTYKDYPQDYERFEDVLERLNRHVEKGSIRHLGVSNDSPWAVMRFLMAAEARGWPRLVSIQNGYNLVNRTFEMGLAEIALREQVGLLAYSPLAQGYLTGKYRGGALPAGSRKALFDRLQRYENDGGEEAIEAYCALAAELGWKPEHLAIRFCDTRPFVTSTIIGATTMEQLKADLDAFAAPWTAEIEKRVNALQRRFRSPCP